MYWSKSPLELTKHLLHARTASSAKTPAALLATLSANGLPSTPAAESFSTELHSRAPRKKVATGTSLKAKANEEEARKKADKERIAMQKQRFSLVMEDEVVASSSSSKASGSGSSDRKKEKKEKGKGSGNVGKSLRKKGDGDAWESDEEERVAKRRREDERYAREDARNGGGSKDVEMEEEVEDPIAKEERLRLEDRKERDDFAARMKDKDKDRTKKLVEDKSNKGDADSLARRALAKDPDALQTAMPNLREISRQSYLNKREEQQLDLLRIGIADDERDFRGMKLTRREREDLDRRKALLKLTEERLAIDEGFDGYQMPDG